MMNTNEMPNREQVQALRDWAAKYGRTWKSKLRDAWMDGDYNGFEDSHLLQQVRNTFGPSFLIRFVLPKSGGFVYFTSADVAAHADKSGLAL